MGEHNGVLTMRSEVKYAVEHMAYMAVVQLTYELPGGAKSQWSVDELVKLPGPHLQFAKFKDPNKAVQWIESWARFAAYCGAKVIPLDTPRKPFETGTNLAQSHGAKVENPNVPGQI